MKNDLFLFEMKFKVNFLSDLFGVAESEFS